MISKLSDSDGIYFLNCSKIKDSLLVNPTVIITLSTFTVYVMKN